MAKKKVEAESAEERLKTRAEAADVEVFDGDAPQGEEENLPTKPDVEEEKEEGTDEPGEVVEFPKNDEELPEDFVLPPIINEYTEIYHYMRTVGSVSNPKFGILAGPELDAEVNSILKAGYQIVDVLAAGYSPEGDRILFIFGKAEGEQEYTEMHFVKRVLGIGEGAITGFNADVWVNYQIEMEGYRVLKTLLNGTPPEGIIVLWILVR